MNKMIFFLLLVIKQKEYEEYGISVIKLNREIKRSLSKGTERESEEYTNVCFPYNVTQ